MKKTSSSSKKKKPLFAEDRSGEETATPRVKKSHSVTNTHYLQLQLDTSAKKRENLDKNLQAKDKRIKDLERELKDQQEYITMSAIKYKDLRQKWEHQRAKNQRTTRDFQDSVELCRDLKAKCRQLMEQNEQLIKAEQQAKEKLAFQETKHKEQKEKWKRQKTELKQLYLPLLEGCLKGRSGYDLIEVKKHPQQP